MFTLLWKTPHHYPSLSAIHTVKEVPMNCDELIIQGVMTILFSGRYRPLAGTLLLTTSERYLCRNMSAK